MAVESKQIWHAKQFYSMLLCTYVGNVPLISVSPDLSSGTGHRLSKNSTLYVQGFYVLHGHSGFRKHYVTRGIWASHPD